MNRSNKSLLKDSRHQLNLTSLKFLLSGLHFFSFEFQAMCTESGPRLLMITWPMRAMMSSVKHTNFKPIIADVSAKIMKNSKNNLYIFQKQHDLANPFALQKAKEKHIEQQKLLNITKNDYMEQLRHSTKENSLIIDNLKKKLQHTTYEALQTGNDYVEECEKYINAQKQDKFDSHFVDEGLQTSNLNELTLTNIKKINTIMTPTGKFLGQYKTSNKTHGMTGFIYDEETDSGDITKMIAYAFHTSRSKFMLNKAEFSNVALNNDANPIKYINPIHVMSFDDFRRCFSISNPLTSLNSTRYGNIEIHDMAYYMLKAGHVSMTQGTVVINFKKTDDEYLNLFIENALIVDENENVYTPAEIQLHYDTIDNSTNTIYEWFSTYIHDIETATGSEQLELKQNLIMQYNDTYISEIITP